MKPKTDSDILDYMERERVIVIPPTEADGVWRVLDRQATQFSEAKNLRDALLKMAYSQPQD